MKPGSRVFAVKTAVKAVNEHDLRLPQRVVAMLLPGKTLLAETDSAGNGKRIVASIFDSR
jgi:hypothetical protein